MEALSPISANIQMKPRTTRQKNKDMAEEDVLKIEAVKKTQKEKEYAAAPPERVIQPPINDGGLAEVFKVGSCIGKGGFAMCYQGWLRDKKEGPEKSLFALKVVKATMSQKKMEEKFRTELQIHAKMRHPNIVEFHRAFTFKESTYVVLEMCSNGSVMDMVKKRRCLTLPEVRRYTVQLCGAIKYMHARNVLHRDLKMGNLFLDQGMNLKIGDFGLAAVLATPEEYRKGQHENAKRRRTTLCGTPNYIAPEILEKGKGHDYKVDVWSIGVIVFAMITGQPPFQSASQNEIYRRARNLEYDWPERDKHLNDIPEEAKDLVTLLLKVNGEHRPDPGEVVCHPFFSMNGGNAIPLTLEPSTTREYPRYLDVKARPRGDVMKKGTERISLRSLARQCGLNSVSEDRDCLSLVGEDSNISLFSQCHAEEKAGRGPVVPMPVGMVYTSKFLLANLEGQDLNETSAAEPDSVLSDSFPPKPINKRVQYLMPERPRRGPVLSHAATLRAAEAPSGAQDTRVRSERNGLHVMSATSRPTTNVASTSVRGQRGLLNELPLRPTSNSSSSTSAETQNLSRNPRVTRVKKVPILDEDIEAKDFEIPKTGKPTSADEIIDDLDLRPDRSRRDAGTRRKIRNVSNAQAGKAEPIPILRKASLEIAKASRAKHDVKPTQVKNSLIGPNEVSECLPKSKPEEVLQQLQRLFEGLETCLNDITREKAQAQEQDNDPKRENTKSLPVVTKWIDYTNKFGVGYILANGTVGCVFKASDITNMCCVVVANSETHFKKCNISSYTDRNQVAASKGAPIEFIENCEAEGLKRVLVPASTYQVKITDGTSDKLPVGTDIHSLVKRQKLSLFDKFARYMHQSLSSTEASLLTNEDLNNTSKSSRRAHSTSKAAETYVKFFQRLGNLQIFGFDDGSFQFNFPDHTKLVFSASGHWLDFYHLPIPAAQALRSTGGSEPVSLTSLAERGVLSYPTQAVLRGRFRGQGFEAVVRENEGREKVRFVRDVVGVWVREGGLGWMGGREMRWEGMGEGKGKLVWGVVGGRGGEGKA